MPDNTSLKTDAVPKNISADQQEELVFNTTVDWDAVSGGLERIGPLSQYMESGISVETFETLISKGLLDGTHSQNRSPTMNTLVEFGRDAREEFDCIDIEYSGYMIDPERDDRTAETRITITSITIRANSGSDIPRPLRRGFSEAFSHADNFELYYEMCSAWWD